MTDIIIDKTQKYKIRAGLCAIYNDDPTLAGKRIVWRLVAQPCSDDGERVGSAKAHLELSMTLPELLQRFPAEAQAAFHAIQHIGEVLCADHADELAAMLADVPTECGVCDVDDEHHKETVQIFTDPETEQGAKE